MPFAHLTVCAEDAIIMLSCFRCCRSAGASMAQVLIRDIAPEVVEKLKARARRNHRSLEAELRVICSEAAGEPIAEATDEISRVRSMFQGRYFSDSAALLREDRER